jgi:hypothetical protein
MPTPFLTPFATQATAEMRRDGRITRAQVIRRAATWVAERVPYSQLHWWTDANGTYRQDCSGYVSMAWHLDQTTNYWTHNLPTVSRPIPADQLRPGDILLSGTHTVIFARWADRLHTMFALYEEFGSGTAARYVAAVPISSYLAGGYVPYRYDGIIEAGDLRLMPAFVAQWAPPAAAAPVPAAAPVRAAAPAPADPGWPSLPDAWSDIVSPLVPSAGPARIAAAGPPPATWPSPVVAALCAALLASSFPVTALLAPQNRAARRGRGTPPTWR